MNQKCLATLGFDKIKEQLAGLTLSHTGREAAMGIMPEDTEEKVLILLRQTQEAETILLRNASGPMTGFNDITPEARRLNSGASLNCRELLNISLLWRSARYAAAHILESEPDSLLHKKAAELFYDDGLIARIDEAIIGEDEISDSASDALYQIRRKMRSENELIRQKLSNIIRSREFGKYLQDAIVTMRGGRYVVPVKQEFRSQIKGLVHGESASGQTLFIEPMSVVEANNRLSELESQEKKEIERVLMALSEQVRPYADELLNTLQVLTELDVIFAKSALARAQRAITPRINHEGVINIPEGRHPLIDPEKVVPISIHVGEDFNCLIVTGPNTGGKTVTLKLCGLFCLMAQSGLMVPAAEGVTLPVFKNVFADIGDEQSIEQSLSTFSSHMKNIIEITRYAYKDSLVLLDELGAGTDPQEGTAIATAVLEELNARGVRLIATTHYSEIKAFALEAPGFMNASMEFNADSLSPTYHLIMGVAGASNAFLISRRLGLSKQILARAQEFMSAERLQFDALVKEADVVRRNAQRRLNEANEMQKTAQNIQKKMEREQQETEEKRRRMLDNARKEALEIVTRAREQSEEAIAEMKKLKDLPEADRTRAIDRTRKTIKREKETLEKGLIVSKKPSKQLDPKKLRLGDSVRIVSLDATGTVSSLPDQRGMVGVYAGIMNMTVSVSDLERVGEQEKKPTARSRIEVTRHSVPLEIDLHGMTVDEALIEVDRYLDSAFLSGLSEVCIVHGKGTGTLRAGIHNFLRRHPHVESFRLGQYGEGENGVTVVSLK